MKLSDKQRNLVRLTLRSPDVGDGWRRVANHLRNFVHNTIEEQQELYEEKDDDDGNMMIRLSARGLVIAEYL